MRFRSSLRSTSFNLQSLRFVHRHLRTGSRRVARCFQLFRFALEQLGVFVRNGSCFQSLPDFTLRDFLLLSPPVRMYVFVTLVLNFVGDVVVVRIFVENFVLKIYAVDDGV